MGSDSVLPGLLEATDPALRRAGLPLGEMRSLQSLLEQMGREAPRTERRPRMIVIFGHHLSWLAALILVGGVWRADRLLIADQWPGWYQLRTRILRKWPPGPARTTELLVCPWCSTLWIAAGTVTAWLFFPTVTLTVCLIFAVSAVAALLTAWTA